MTLPHMPSPQRKIIQITPGNLYKHEDLFRGQDIGSVRDLVDYLDAQYLNSYLVGGVVNRLPKKYSDIDMIATGHFKHLVYVNVDLERGIDRAVRFDPGSWSGMKFRTKDVTDDQDERIANELVLRRLLLIPEQSMVSRWCFGRKSEIDLSLMSEENFREMQFRKLHCDGLDMSYMLY